MCRQLEEEAMRRDPANYRPLCVAKTGFFSDHGVLVCKDKHTRDFLLRSIPDVAGPGSGTTKAVPGVDGHFVKVKIVMYTRILVTCKCHKGVNQA